MFALLAAGSPVVTSHLLPPDDPRAWGFPAGMSRSGFIWRSPKEGRLYSRMHSVQTPTALEAWFEVPGSLLSADGTLHPAIQYTYADSWLNGFALGVSVAVTVTASLRCSFTQAGRRFCGGWVVLRGRPVERTGRRVRLAAELASEAGDVLMRAEGEFAVIGPAPRM
ncbi:hypothetical protein DFJ74DRAFT_695081 [Hyaloraphidium curvatum]|nr:hypothetical protein DFJ74DRAFT_695081 [Hyaloraphidium curvatum]